MEWSKVIGNVDQPLRDEIDELLWSKLSEEPLTERLWEAGGQPVDVEPKELVGAVRAFNRGVRAAVLRLAEEVEQLKARDEAVSPNSRSRS